MMLKRIGANTLRYLLTLLVASLVIFIALRVIPGNPAEVALGVTATDESVAKLSATMGIDKPLWQQYVTWVQGLVTGNLGMSLTSGADISPLVFDRLQVSIILVGCAMVMALGLSIPLGVWAARRARKWDGVAITVLSQIGGHPPGGLVRGAAQMGAGQRLVRAQRRLWGVRGPTDTPGDFAGHCAGSHYDTLRAFSGARRDG